MILNNLQPTCNQLATDAQPTHNNDSNVLDALDLISRNAVIAEFSCCELTPDGGIDVNYAIDFLKQLPTAQPKPDENTLSEQQESAKLGVKTGETCTDCISRQAAIDAPEKFIKDCNPEHFVGHQKFIEFMDDAEIGSFGNWQFANGFNMGLTAAEVAIKNLPSAKPERRYDEWCTDCKEYDQEKHCCPRWNRVIRTTLQEVQEDRKKGKWAVRIIRGNWNDEEIRTCPNCGKTFRNLDIANYCPNCGLPMEVENDE